jgi:hypothetical protein
VSAVTVTVTRSGGADGAMLVFIDTDFEPNGSDDGPGLRVRLNDDIVYEGKAYRMTGGDHREASSVELAVELDDIRYLDDVPADVTDAAACRREGAHQVTTRHNSQECPVVVDETSD